MHKALPLLSRRSVLATLPFTAPLVLQAQTGSGVSATEKLLTEVGVRFRGLIEPVNDEQWNFRVLTIKHTIGEEAEHIALSEQELQRMVVRALRAPKDEALAISLRGKEETVRELLLDEDKVAENYQAPNRLKSKAEVLEFFGAAETKAMTLLRSRREFDLHATKHPDTKFGQLTAMQWFHYIAYHAERHCQQIESLKAHPDFPGRVRSA